MAEAGGGINIPSFLQRAFDDAGDSITSTLQDVTGVMKQGTQSVEAQSAAIQDSAKAKNEVARLTALARLKRETADKQASAAIGTNPEASSYIIAAMSDSILNIKAELDQRDTALQEKLDTKFGDDPVGWIVNQFTIPGDIVAYEHRQKKLIETGEVMDKAIARTTANAAMNAAIDAGTGMEKIAAEENQNLAEARIKVETANQNLVQMNLQGINIRRAVNKEQFDMTIAANNADVQQQQLQLSRSHLQIAQRSADLQEFMKTLAIDEKTEKAELLAVQQNKLDRTTATLGMPRMSVAEYRTLTGKRKDLLQDAMGDVDIEEGRLGFNAAAALQTANGLNMPLTPGGNIVREKLIGWMAGVEAADPTWKTKDPGQKNLAIQKEIETRLKAEAKNVPDEDGVYSPPPLSAVLKIPAVASMGIAKDLSVLGASQNYKTSATDIFRIVSEKIVNSKSPEEKSQLIKQTAAEIATMYEAISVDNRTQRLYKKLVIPPLTPATGFNVNVYTGSGWSGSQMINMMDKAQVENALIRRAVRAEADASTGLNPPQGVQ